MTHRKVFVVGAGGMVGATVAQTLAVREIVHEIVLIDVAEDVARGQATDISHATAFAHHVTVRTGSYTDIAEDDIIIITAGIAQQPGQSRQALVHTNARIVEGIVQEIRKQDVPVFIVVVSNPVDTMTMVALEASGLGPERVFGSGTTLDSARLQVHLAKELNVSPLDVNAYILGEHGDSSFAAFSAANIAGVPLADFPGYDPEIVSDAEELVRQAAYDIIATKKSTYYGIGNSVAAIISALLSPATRVMPLSTLVEDSAYDLPRVAISLPCLINREGVARIGTMPFNMDEHERLLTSAAVIAHSYESITTAAT